jgi:hypothetical protein
MYWDAVQTDTPPTAAPQMSESDAGKITFTTARPVVSSFGCFIKALNLNFPNLEISVSCRISI